MAFQRKETDSADIPGEHVRGSLPSGMLPSLFELS